MKYLELLKSYKNSEKIAINTNDTKITFKELILYSDRLAKYIVEKIGIDDKTPIPVYGHKDFLMIVCFLACTKSGHAYCPIDISFTENRIKSVLDVTESKLSLFTKDLDMNDNYNILNKEDILNIINDEKYDSIYNDDLYKIGEEDIVYIIFTSGSTGVPKGVKITYSNLNNYLDWIYDVVGEKNNIVYLNQAPFSFDLSVMDLYLSLISESTLHCLTKEIQNDFKLLLDNLIGSKVENWVSTPSFVDLCLSFKEFNCENLPNLKVFLFCGEVLTKKTCERLMDRFPNSRIINTYGPTESTVCVTNIDITREILNSYDSMPLGYAKPGTEIIISKDDIVLSDGEIGEIIIIGNTVSSGYFKNENQTKKSFFVTDSGKRGYRTGDCGYLKNGNLFFVNRMDFQIKLHGYRIELGDIETNLLKIDGINSACVVESYDTHGKVKSLVACVVCDDDLNDGIGSIIKKKLEELIPNYMVPKKFKFFEKLPMNSNSKIDRKELKQLLNIK